MDIIYSDIFSEIVFKDNKYYAQKKPEPFSGYYYDLSLSLTPTIYDFGEFKTRKCVFNALLKFYRKQIKINSAYIAVLMRLQSIISIM